jgi:hypothetical protein
MKSPSLIPLLTPPITQSDNMHVKLPDEANIDIKEFLQRVSLDIDVTQIGFELRVSPNHISENITPLPIPDIFEMCQ